MDWAGAAARNGTADVGCVLGRFPELSGRLSETLPTVLCTKCPGGACSNEFSLNSFRLATILRQPGQASQRRQTAALIETADSQQAVSERSVSGSFNLSSVPVCFQRGSPLSARSAVSRRDSRAQILPQTTAYANFMPWPAKDSSIATPVMGFP